MSGMKTALLVFAGIALFVGIFIIANTFTMLVAQRTRELALMRAVGATRRQVTRSVLIEAFVVGAVAAVAGLAAGIGIAAGCGRCWTRTGATRARTGRWSSRPALSSPPWSSASSSPMLAAWLPAPPRPRRSRRSPR